MSHLVPLRSRAFRPAASDSPIIGLLKAAPQEADHLARLAGLTTAATFAALEALAWDGLIDAQDPPEPAGREHLGWFIRPCAMPVACQPL